MYKRIFVLTLCIVTISCSNSKNENTPKEKVEVINSCLLNYRDKLDKIIADKEVYFASKTSEKDVEKEYSKMLKNPDHHSLDYNWTTPTGRKEKMGTMEFDAFNKLSITAPKKMNFTSFKLSYHPKTEAQIKQMESSMNKEVDKVFEGKSKSASANKNVEKLDKIGLDKNTSKNISKGFLKKALEIAKRNTVVNGIGESAVWNTKSNDLYVYSQGICFSVNVNFGNDEKNLNIAKNLVNTILEKCN